MTNKNESIYQSINRMAEELPGTPYVFQNISSAGLKDVLYVLWDDGLPVSIKEKLAMELVNKIVVSIHQSESLLELSGMLEENPIHLYLTNLSNRIRLVVQENLIEKTALYPFAIRLTTRSHKVEEVKLGMLLLGIFDNDITRKIIKTLGFHSSFTIYAVEASRNFENRNELLFEILQNTSGFGKLAALTHFQPIQFNQQIWLLESGAVNEIARNMSAIICLEKVDMGDFFKNLTIDESVFSKLSYLIAYAAEESDIKRFTQSLLIVKKYIEVAKYFAKEFIDLAAITVIEKSMKPFWHYHGQDVKKENGWASNIENDLRTTCKELLNQPKWKNVILQELDQPTHKTSLIALVMKQNDFKPAFHSFTPLLKRDLFDIDLLSFFLMENRSHYLDEVYSYLLHVLPDEVLCTGAQSVAEEDISSEFSADIWLVYLLKGLRIERRNEEDFFIRCLTCRFPDARKEAIHALRVNKIDWSPAVMLALKKTLEKEPLRNIKKMMQRLVGENTEPDKEMRFVDVSEIQVKPSSSDRHLVTTKIAGSFFRDLMVVDGRVEKDDILYLVRGPENPYDSNAILVTSEDGYVLGYVPKAINAMPALMIDTGEKLYAIFSSEDMKDKNLVIQLMQSRDPEKQGVLIEFPRFKK